MTRLYITRDGIWLWLFGLGILWRNHAKNPVLYSERYGRDWYRVIGSRRLTIKWRRGKG